MTKSYSFLFFIFLTTFNSLYSQEYFQQEVNYTIQVKLDDQKHELYAFETIEYINNSPDELEFIYFHLWPNAYDNNGTALGKQLQDEGWRKLFKEEELRGYIDSLDFKVDNKKVHWEYDSEHIDICKVFLNQPLKPGAEITISTPFHIKIPKGVTSRLGHIGESYQISQWYPKPAVYDQYGWHQMPYLDMGEFYSEFGSFDVSITLPQNYIVGATGDLQNTEEIEWMNSLVEKTKKKKNFDDTYHVFPKSSKEFKTIRFKQENIHDFAWFADKRFHVLKGEREMPNTGRVVTIWSLFLNRDADIWLNSLEYIGDALHYYSLYTGDYPYNQCTAVHSALSAGRGMEYPNVTVIGDIENARLLEVVIMHEVGHNWFYGILGFNEREYPWMDEGINTFCEGRYMRDKYGEDDALYHIYSPKKKGSLRYGNIRYNKSSELSYLNSARYNIDQQASLHSEEYSRSNYGNIIYQKTAKIFEHLMGYLGDEKFNEIFKSFYEEWKYKHPYPKDIRIAFEKGTGEDLSWIFDDLLQTTKRPDYKFTRANKSGFTIKNVGEVEAPVNVTAFQGDEIVFSKWYSGFSGKKKFDINLKSVDKLVIDPIGNMLEFNRKDNAIRTKGMFKKTEPIHFKFSGKIENEDKTQINFFPLIGWNNYNKFMLGAVFYNPGFPRSRFEYQLMPMYSFGANALAGSARIAYNIIPVDAKIRDLKLKATAMQYAYNNAQGVNFQKYTVEAHFFFRNKNAKSRVSNSIVFKAIFASNLESILAGVSPELNQYYNVKFSHKKYRKLNPYSISVGAQLNKDFVKSDMEALYKVHFFDKKFVNFRLYTGVFLYKVDDLHALYNINLSGTNGIDDYTYDGAFIGRFENPGNGTFLSNQFIPNEGAFSIYSPHGRTNEWLASLNISSAIPYVPNVFRIYANIAAFGKTQAVAGFTDLDNYAWETGIKLILFDDRIQVFAPVFVSKDLDNISNELYWNHLKRIRFSINLSFIH